MNWEQFITVGENIHCTRIVKRNGIRTTTLAGGIEAVKYTRDGEELAVPVPAGWESRSPSFADGKIKHVALAVYQALNGSAADKAMAEGYLCYLAERQINAGAVFLDVNVDEYSTDPAEAGDVMAYLAGFLSDKYDTPLSVDSSNPDTLRIGLATCRTDIRPPMLNSISLERPDAIALAKEFNADAIVNAVGREGMPADASERMANFRELMPLLDEAGIARDKVHLDPLVLPISTDPLNGSHFLGATASARAEFEGIHLNGGLSNISFGMPSRKLLNMVFVHLCAEAGTDGGIIDPAVMPPSAVAALDSDSEPFKLARAVLTGEDMFGMEYITAYRDGRLG